MIPVDFPLLLDFGRRSPHKITNSRYPILLRPSRSVLLLLMVMILLLLSHLSLLGLHLLLHLLMLTHAEGRGRRQGPLQGLLVRCGALEHLGGVWVLLCSLHQEHFPQPLLVIRLPGVSTARRASGARPVAPAAGPPPPSLAIAIAVPSPISLASFSLSSHGFCCCGLN